MFAIGCLARWQPGREPVLHGLLLPVLCIMDRNLPTGGTNHLQSPQDAPCHRKRAWTMTSTPAPLLTGTYARPAGQGAPTWG